MQHFILVVAKHCNVFIGIQYKKFFSRVPQLVALLTKHILPQINKGYNYIYIYTPIAHEKHLKKNIQNIN